MKRTFAGIAVLFLLTAAACTPAPHVYHHTRAQAAAEAAGIHKTAAEEEQERMTHLNDAIIRQVEEIREADGATARVLVRGQRLAGKYGIKTPR